MGVGGDYERRIASEAKRVAKYSVTLTECNSLLQVFLFYFYEELMENRILPALYTTRHRLNGVSFIP